VLEIPSTVKKSGITPIPTEALLVHPLGPKVDQVQAVRDDMLETHKEHLPQFWN